ncbi:MAG: hypothetical protein KIT72_05520 [Polyangiaceae bacterium]|nr:hypothetical protein [Polyangiaceae bacterium]MCW5789858.1 hypothetical protein [Polyangiaceae bacterium]
MRYTLVRLAEDECVGVERREGQDRVLRPFAVPFCRYIWTSTAPTCGDGGRPLGREEERRPAGQEHRLIKGQAHRPLRERLCADDAGCGAILVDERVDLVKRRGVANGLRQHAHVDRGKARERDHRVQHDAQRVGGLRDGRERARVGRSDLRGAPPSKARTPSTHTRGRAVDAIGPGVDALDEPVAIGGR